MAVPFSGGDHLSATDGLKYFIHKTMMLNELKGGVGAYEMSNAVLAASGPSFGAIQYDLGSNGRGRKLFESILGAATNSEGERIVSDAEIKEFRDNFYQPFKDLTKEQKQRYAELKPVIDQALGSAEGIRQINADYDKVLDKKVEYVNEVVAGVTNMDNRAYLEKDMKSQVQIADIRNQYGDAVNNALKEFLNQSAEGDGVQIPKGGDLVKVQGGFDNGDIGAFRMGTAYGKDHPKDAQRREDNIDKVTKTAAKGTVVGDRSSLLPESQCVLQDCEQHVRGLADRHGLPWDQGMNNTVLSIAQQAREQGLTGVTHFKAADGQIRFAQLDGGVLKEGTMDARLAANTDGHDSMARMAQLDVVRSLPVMATENTPLRQLEAAAPTR